MLSFACGYYNVHNYICYYYQYITHIHTHTYICMHVHTYIHTYIHACMHTYIHTYIHTYMHSCTNIVPIELTCRALQISPSSGPNVLCFTNVPYTSVSCSFDGGPPESCKLQRYNVRANSTVQSYNEIQP